jgi:hypothetical protein
MLYQLSYAPGDPPSFRRVNAIPTKMMVETRGFEPLTLCLQSRCSTN